MLFMLAIVALQMALTAGIVVWAIARNRVRVRFTLRGLFALITVLAVSLGIIRLPVAWPFKCMILWGVVACCFGLAVARRPPFRGPVTGEDRGRT